jgi:hypothetical protein
MAALAECGASDAEISALRDFVRTNPALMAQSAIGQGRTNFLGVAGYSVAVPGIDGPSCFVDRTNVRVVPGTTDVICNAEHAQLIHSASEYAAKYNAVVKDFLVANGAFSCAK